MKTLTATRKIDRKTGKRCGYLINVEDNFVLPSQGVTKFHRDAYLKRTIYIVNEIGMRQLKKMYEVTID